MDKIKAIDPTSLPRKKRKEILKQIDKQLGDLKIVKNRNMQKLLEKKLTVQEIEDAMKGNSLNPEVKKVVQTLLDVNNSLVSLAQQKSRLLAYRDSNRFTPIPANESVPPGSSIVGPISGFDNLSGNH